VLAKVGLPWLAAVVTYNGCPMVAGQTCRLAVVRVEEKWWVWDRGVVWWMVGRWAVGPEAARHGHLAVLQWARNRGWPLDEKATAFAAEGGQLAALRWLLEHHCPWDADACAAAA
jgi:hypothetical protein